MRAFLCLLLLSLALFAGAGDALAAGQAQRDPAAASNNNQKKMVDPVACSEIQSDTNNQPGLFDDFIHKGGTVCPCSEGMWLHRIVGCFSSDKYGLIPVAVKNIIASQPYSNFYNSLVYGTMLLAVVLFGVNLTLGSVYSLPKESFTLVLKIGGVMFFFSQYEKLYDDMLHINSGLVNIVSNAAGNIGNLCGSTGASIWARWDCLISDSTGLIVDAGGYVAIGMLAFLSGLFFSGGVGMVLAITIGYVLITLITIGMRAVFTYLAAIIAFSFLYLLAPFFVPLIFFGKQYERFATWLKLMLAYLLQPMLLMLFLVIMLTAVEFAVFVGPSSLFGAFANYTPTKSMSFKDLMTGGGQPSAVTGGSDYTKMVKRDTIIGYTEHVTSDVNTLNQSQPDAVDTKGVDSGFNPQMPAASSKAAKNPAGTYDVGLVAPTIDEAEVQSQLNISFGDWMQNLMLQAIACGILVFVLYQMVKIVPDITSDLVAQEFGNRFGSASKTRMIGESEMKKGMEASKEAARRGKETGDNREAARSVLNEMTGW